MEKKLDAFNIKCEIHLHFCHLVQSCRNSLSLHSRQIMLKLFSLHFCPMTRIYVSRMRAEVDWSRNGRNNNLEFICWESTTTKTLTIKSIQIRIIGVNLMPVTLNCQTRPDNANHCQPKTQRPTLHCGLSPNAISEQRSSFEQ